MRVTCSSVSSVSARGSRVIIQPVRARDCRHRSSPTAGGMTRPALLFMLSDSSSLLRHHTAPHHQFARTTGFSQTKTCAFLIVSPYLCDIKDIQHQPAGWANAPHY